MNPAEVFSEYKISLKFVFDSLAEGILILNNEGKLIYANQSSASILKFSLDHYPTKEWAKKLNIYHVNTQKPLSYHEMPIVRALKGNRFSDYRLFIQHAGLERGIYISVNAQPLIDEYGNYNGAMATFQDITRRLIKEKAVKNINASKLESLGVLAANIAHEIKNPLGVIRTSVSALLYMMKENAPTELLHRQLSVIDTTAMRISDMASALNNLSRNTTNELFAKSSVNDILKDVNLLLGEKLRAKNIRLFLDDSENLINEILHCLRIQISQVLINVIRNAADAVEEQADPEITIKLRKDSSCFYFMVIDSGPGVPESVRDHLFEPFFTTKTLGKGTGIGLSISREIMKKHKGEIYLDEDGGKNCFVIKIPGIIQDHPGKELN